MNAQDLIADQRLAINLGTAFCCDRNVAIEQYQMLHEADDDVSHQSGLNDIRSQVS